MLGLFALFKQRKSPDDEIRALGTEFSIKNEGTGTLLLNDNVVKDVKVYGFEKLKYVFGKDTLQVPLSNGMSEGMEALFVMDVNGKTNLIPIQTMELDTAKSFLKLASLKVTNEFKPREKAIMLESEAQKLSSRTFTGEGAISMKSYKPNHLVF
jgi:hypothetical protein